MNKPLLFGSIAAAIAVVVLLWVFVGWTAAGGAVGAMGALATASKKARERIDKEVEANKKQAQQKAEQIRTETNGLLKKVSNEQDPDQVRANAEEAMRRARAARHDINLWWLPLLIGLGLNGCAHQQHVTRPTQPRCSVLLSSSSDTDLIRRLTAELEKMTGELKRCKVWRKQLAKEVDQRKTQTTLARAETLVGKEKIRELRGELTKWIVVGVVVIIAGAAAGIGWTGTAAGWW